jgi:hypothetical protein
VNVQRHPELGGGLELRLEPVVVEVPTRTATLVIATIRGLLLDLLATGDRDRVQDAAESFLASLEHKAQEHGAPDPGELQGGQR